MRFLINLLITIAVIVSCSRIGRNLPALTGQTAQVPNRDRERSTLLECKNNPKTIHSDLRINGRDIRRCRMCRQ